jgi:hypothetical protein
LYRYTVAAPLPDFAALQPASLAPPTGHTLDHGIGIAAAAHNDGNDAYGGAVHVVSS